MSDIEIDVDVIHSTDKDLLADNGNGKEVWAPKSWVSDYCEERDGTITSIFMAEWRACEKGLV